MIIVKRALAILFLLCFAGCMYYMYSQPDCIRIIPDGSVRCECEYKSSDAWDKYKKDTKGAWEAVAFPDGYDPCKK